MGLYKKCSVVSCVWHMGNNHILRTYLNGACYHYNHNENMFCPLNSYEIITHEGQKAIKCLKCNRTSYNSNDVEQLYCGHCHEYHK